jgi:hypothetical protein
VNFRLAGGSEADLRFIDQAYLMYLRRPAHPAGAQLWLSALMRGAVSRDGFVEAILASPEYYARAH